MKPLYIYGAGGLGREVLWLARAIGEWEVKGFVDDHVRPDTRIADVSVLGGGEVLNGIPRESFMVIAIGDPRVKEMVLDKLKSWDFQYAQLVHPSVIIMDRDTVHLAPGVIIGAGTILTTGIAVGSHSMINLNVTIGHGTSIGRGCSVMPGVNIAGGVHVDEFTLIGSGASILGDLNIGKRVRIGSGAVVLRSLPDAVTAVGVPSQIIQG